MSDHDAQIDPAVFIIESPSAADVLDGRAEGHALFSALRLARITCHYFNVANKDAFEECFRRIALKTRPMTRIVAGSPPERTVTVPYIHLSAHGNQDGIALTGGEFVAWSVLRELLIEYASSMKLIGRDDACLLTLCMSSCKGAYARSMMEVHPPFACTALVGTDRDVDWADALTAFLTFYHLMIYKDRPATEAVRQMNHSSGLDNPFAAITYKDILDG